MPAQQFNKISATEATALGITIPNTETEFRKLLVQANLPRPGRASRVLVTTENVLIPIHYETALNIASRI